MNYANGLVVPIVVAVAVVVAVIIAVALLVAVVNGAVRGKPRHVKLLAVKTVRSFPFPSLNPFPSLTFSRSTTHRSLSPPNSSEYIDVRLIRRRIRFAVIPEVDHSGVYYLYPGSSLALYYPGTIDPRFNK